jgi:uncharacterized protein (DUF1330 family)
MKYFRTGKYPLKLETENLQTGLDPIMTVTLLATMKIQDKEILQSYRQKAGEALAKHGGSVVAAGALSNALEGSADFADTAAIISFPDADAAQNWISDPELAPTHALRNAAGKSSIMMIG